MTTPSATAFEIQNRLSRINRYNRWIWHTVQPFCGRRVLDVGCGIGNITQYMLARELVIGLDVLPEFVAEIKARFNCAKNFDAFCYDICDPFVLELSRFEFDTITCLNVLEHIEDDRLALWHMNSLLVPNGRLILLVPAHRWLYGTMDATDHHFRRYTKQELVMKMIDARFMVLENFYFNSIGILGWFLNGRVLKRKFVSESHYGGVQLSCAVPFRF